MEKIEYSIKIAATASASDQFWRQFLYFRRHESPSVGGIAFDQTKRIIFTNANRSTVDYTCIRVRYSRPLSSLAAPVYDCASNKWP